MIDSRPILARTRNELFTLLDDRRFWRGPALGTVVAFAALNLATVIWHKDIVGERQANLLLNSTDVAGAAAAVTDIRQNASGRVRFDQSVGENLEAFWPAVPDARRQPLVILAGMSQNYAINDQQPGDQTIVEWIDDALAPRGVRAFGLSAPNLSTEEALFLLEASIADPSTKPDTFIYGVCFDKLRNTDLRPGYQRVLSERTWLQSAWQSTAESLASTHPAASEKMLATLHGLGTQSGQTTDQPTVASQGDSTEQAVRDTMAQAVPLIGVRKELNTGIQLRLFLARNALLNIKPTSKRPMIQSRYDTNTDLLAVMAEVARVNHVQLILYVTPLNPVAENPYIPEEYAAFKVWIADFAAQRDIPFANFDNIVPESAWGEFMGGPDFKHFRGEGHHITAQAIMDTFGSYMASR